MSKTNQKIFVLTGPLAGKSINLGSLPYPFRDGKLLITATPDELALHARFLERNWQAYPEGHPKLVEVSNGQRNIPPEKEPNSEPPIPSDVQPSGEGSDEGEPQNDGEGTTDAPQGEAGDLPDGDGYAEELNERLAKAVRSLDPENDDHWTKDGRPTMAAVEKSYGATDFTRADVDAVAPGYTRDKARGGDE